MTLKRCNSAYAALALLASICLLAVAKADLPQDLDPFLEKLFSVEECEEFMSDGSFLSIETRDCAPFTCDFPHQLCMRPATLYSDEKANQCRDLPQTCLTAANGGVPVPRVTEPALLPVLSSKSVENSHGNVEIKPKHNINSNTDSESGLEFTRPVENLGGSGLSSSVVEPQPETKHGFNGGNTAGSGQRQHFGSICEQGVPDGRFCGFELKFTFNRETHRCEQFWYPGCRTENTNDNLFVTAEQCQVATNHCGVGIGKNVGVSGMSRSGDNGGGFNGNNGVSGSRNVVHQRRIEAGNGGNGGAGELAGLLGGGVSNSGESHGSNNIPEQIVSIGRSLNGNGGNGGGPGGRAAVGQNVVNTFSRFLTGSALGSENLNQGGGFNGNANGAARGAVGSSEYGGGALGTGDGDGSSVTQPPNFIRLIANTIREVGSAQQHKGGNAAAGAGGGLGKGAHAADLLNRFDPGQFASILQSFG